MMVLCALLVAIHAVTVHTVRVVVTEPDHRFLDRLDLDTNSVTARCLSDSSSEAAEFERGSARVGNVRACGNQTYPRSCLKSHVPQEATYGTIKACFRCCLFYWTRALGLNKNFQTLERKRHLGDENNDVPYNHSLTEVTLSPNSIMKFADVAFTNQLYSRYNRQRERNGFVRVGTRWVVDPDGPQRPCVSTLDSQCVIRDGGVIVARRFFFDPQMFEVNSWAKSGQNISVLLDRDVAQGSPEVWHDLKSSGLRVYRTNPRQQLWDFPLATSAKLEGDQFFYPLGMSSKLAPETLERLLAQHRRTFAEKERLFSCTGVRVEKEPPSVQDHRRKVLDVLSPHFNCSGDRLKVDEFYRRLGASKFALSPRGGGHNCYRTWEILALGSIPVLDYHPAHEDLYRGLPTVQVKDWRDVTPAFLAREWTRINIEMRSNRISNAKAFLPFWIGEIYGRLPDP